MNILQKRVFEVKDDAAMKKMRSDWEELRALHNAYDKHEPYARKNSGGYGAPDHLHFCRICGQVLMTKNTWDDSGHKVLRKPMERSCLRKYANRYSDSWEIGMLTEQDVKMIPKEFRHFVYEQLFWRLGEDDLKDDEAAAILSCRDKNIPHDQLREYSVQSGGAFAYAYAKSYNDYADDLKQAAYTVPTIAFKFLRDSKKPISDSDRVAISRDYMLAFQIAKEIDKAPHPVTRNAVARNPMLAARYAIEIDKDATTATTRGTPLRKIAMRTNASAETWQAHFREKPKAEDRAVRSQTKMGAFRFAEKVDKGPHPVTEKGVYGSFYYATRYAYEIKGAPFEGAEAACQSAGWKGVEYALTFRRCSDMLEQGSLRNRGAADLYREFKMELNKKPEHRMDHKTAMKKSVWAMVKMAVDQDWDNPELKKRAERNRIYGYIADWVRGNLKNIAKAQARIAAAKSE